ncbi:MAG TPA: protein phosphatase 2C domain-containing protein [Candidatus Didemnitutus sp.]
MAIIQTQGPVSDGANPATNRWTLSWAAATDRGHHRECNEDAWGVFSLSPVSSTLASAAPCPPEGALFILSDGMGGARAGEVASRICVEQLARSVGNRPAGTPFATALRTAFDATHTALVDAGRNEPNWLGMGATLTAFVLMPDGHVTFGHIGDSRLYRHSQGAWRQATDDHSLGDGLVRRGQMTPDAAARFRFRALLEQVMGGDGRPIDPQIGEFSLAPGEALILCCDGLYRPLEESLAARFDAAIGSSDLAGAAQGFIDAANAAGGPDNITVVLARATI